MDNQLARHCRVLSNFSKNPSLSNIDTVMKALITLCNNKSHIQIEIQGYIKCFVCQKVGGNKIPINCTHVVHSECLLNKAKSLSNDTLDPDRLVVLSCQFCKRVISPAEYTKIIGKSTIQAYQNKANQKILQEIRKKDEQERQEQIKRLSFQCPVCLEQTRIQEGITMSCSNNHRLCKDCAREGILQQIKEGKYAPGTILCVAEGCGQALDEQLIKESIGKEQFEKYTNLQYKNLKVQGLVIRQCNGYIYKDGKPLVQIKQNLPKKQYEALQDEMQRKCNAIQSGNVPGAELKGEVIPCTSIISFDPKQNAQGGILKCPLCQLDTCIKGCSSAHRGNTCEKYKQWQQTNKKSKQLSFQQIRAMGMAQCQNPKCKVPILRSQGCNWIKCKCGFELCYLCSRPWTRDDPHVSGGGHAPFDVQRFLATH